MICDFGDVAVVPFPFTDLAVTRYRPALVLSQRPFNDANGNTVLAMITTAAGSAWPSDLPIAEIAAAGLVKNCYVRWKIFTLQNHLVDRTIGRLASADLTAARSAVSAILA